MIKRRKMKVMIINRPNKGSIGIGINKKNKKLFKLRIMSILNNNSRIIIMGLDCRLATTKTKSPKSRAKITIKTKLKKKRQKMVMTIIITKSLDFRILLKIKKKKGKMIFKRTLLKNRKN